MMRKKAKTQNDGYLPICLNVAGQKCLIVGGGRVAWRKISVLRKFGAAVTCLSPAFLRPIEDLGKRKKITCLKKPYGGSTTLGKYALVIAATDNPAVNRKVARDALREKTLVNVIDKSAEGSVIMPAILKRKGLTVGVSTGGQSPRQAKRIREILKNAL